MLYQTVFIFLSRAIVHENDLIIQIMGMRNNRLYAGYSEIRSIVVEDDDGKLWGHGLSDFEVEGFEGIVYLWKTFLEFCSILDK